jgi:plasmid stabilization system protein ParE
MAVGLIIRDEAEADIARAAVWYDQQRSGLGNEFLEQIEATLNRVIANPHAFRCIRRKPDVRRALTKRFPYRIFFILRPDAIVVFRVLHNARADQEWTTKVPTD